MLERVRQWPGPPAPMLTEATDHQEALRVLGSVRPHAATHRARTAMPLFLSLASAIPILLGSLPLFLLIPLPIMWILLPWVLRSEWLATQTTFCPDRLLVRAGQADKQPRTILLTGLGRIDARMDPVQARTGSCTLHFLQVTENPEDPLEPFTVSLAHVRDVEASTAHSIMDAYGKLASLDP